MALYQFTTPTLKVTLRDRVTKEVLTDLDFDYLFLTIKGGDSEIERKVLKEEYTEGTFTVTLTQEETATLGNVITLQANIIKNSSRFGTTKASKNLECNLKNEVIDL